MNREIECNSCQKSFCLDLNAIKTIKNGDYEVQYFSCPHCQKDYQVITTDTHMRELIRKREQLGRKIQLAREKSFREEAYSKYVNELSLLKSECERRAAELKKIGDDILKGSDSENG